MRRKIIIDGKEYPIRVTIGAMVAYKRDTGEDFTSFKGDDMEKVGLILYHATRSACKADGVVFPFEKPEDMLDFIDMEQASEILGDGGGDKAGDPKKN